MLNNKNLVRDIMNARKEREEGLRKKTQDEIAEEFVSKFLANHNGKIPRAKKSPELDAELRKILEHTEPSHPETNPDFMENIPLMHLSWFAMNKIDQHVNMAKIYSLVLTKIYKKNIPFEIEKAILAFDTDDLILLMNKAGLEWSKRAQTVMSRMHPKVYHSTFELSTYQASYLMR